MAATTMTRIMLDCMMEDGFRESIRSAVERHGFDHALAVDAVEQFLHQTVYESLDGSSIPDFAHRIIEHALSQCVDWRFVSERVLADPEDN